MRIEPMMTILHFFQMLIEHIDCTERLNVQSSKSKFIFHPICLTLIVLYNIPRWTLDFWFFDHEHFVKQELSRVSRHQVLVWLGAGGEQQDVREGKVPSYVEHYSIFHVSWCNTTLKVFSTPPHALTFTDN